MSHGQDCGTVEVGHGSIELGHGVLRQLAASHGQLDWVLDCRVNWP